MGPHESQNGKWKMEMNGKTRGSAKIRAAAHAILSATAVFALLQVPTWQAVIRSELHAADVAKAVDQQPSLRNEVLARISENFARVQSMPPPPLSESSSTTAASAAAFRSFMIGLNDKYTRVIGTSEQGELAAYFDTVPFVLRQSAGRLDVARSEMSGKRPHDETDLTRLMPGDQIFSINDVSTAGMSVYTAADMLESSPGPIKLEFTRGDSGARSTLLLESGLTGRDSDAADDVEYQLKRASGRKVGYIRISRFSAGVSSLVSEAVASLQQTRDGAADVWVLDLRGNPGGLVREAQRVAGIFLGDGGVLVRVSAEGLAGRGSVSSRLPALLPTGRGEGGRAQGDTVGQGQGVIVIVDEGSASASEFVAVALEEGRGATIAGKQTRGKALIQGLFPLEQSGNAVIVTTGLVSAPSSTCSWQGAGLRPRVKMELLPPSPLPLPVSLPELSRLIENVAAEAAMPRKPSVAASPGSPDPHTSACASGGSPSARGVPAFGLEQRETALQGAFRCPTYWACGWDLGT